VARTYKTLSLSLPPAVVDELVRLGQPTGRTAARFAAEIVLHEVAARSETRKGMYCKSWCCDAALTLIQGPLVILNKGHDTSRAWISVVVLLCETCKRQMHGREYEGWVVDA
jgi:hypothetical protein